MSEFFSLIFDTSDFPARWHCGNWSDGHGWLHVLSDAAIAAAYVSIPLTLIFVARRRRDLPFIPMFWLFGAFILACGACHLLEAVIFWHPMYRLAGLVKLTTALVSWATVFALLRLLPAALTLRSPAALEREVARQTQVLRAQAAANAALASEIEIKNRELERSNQDLAMFAHVVSHDLQEPLRTVTGYLQLIQRRYANQLDSDADEFIEFAVGGAKRMRALLEDVLDYSRLDSQGEKFARVELSELMDDVLTTLGTAVSESGAEIEVGPMTAVFGDRTQLTQVLQNLIANSLRFCGDAPPKIHISSTRDGDWCTVVVRDHGIGFDMKYADRIFTMFQRLHGHEIEGTGIGLAIVKRVIERHGGKLWAESKPGEGAAFSFTLPVSAPDMAPPA
ncbi:MAG: hypothetical protein Tsb0020_01730 [Haliangiales bacterium]